MSGSKEFHMEHVIYGYISYPKNSCFLAFPIYWLCLSFSRQVFCDFVMFLFVHKLLECLLSMSLLAIRLSIFDKLCGYSF